MNMQSASVVILCEPQVKPSLEDQAVRRAHRMGQARGVNVHRLLADEGVDIRMRQILAPKRAAAAAYADRSEIGETAPEAVDISEESLFRQVIEEERRRLGLTETPEDEDGEPLSA
jgi:SNF2 family DNA or RNA helicase